MVLKDDRRWVIHMGYSYARKIVLIYKEMGYLYEEICFHTRKWIICMSHSYKELSYSYKFCIQGKELFIYKEMSSSYTKKWVVHKCKKMSYSYELFIQETEFFKPGNEFFIQESDFFPTCQVRVVRFYHSCSPPPRLAVLLLVLLVLLLQFLLDHVCINFHLHFRLANSSPSSLPTSQLSAHCWTSTWELPSSVRTAGPQPRTFLAQCAPLDLNLGPSQLSAHRWT